LVLPRRAADHQRQAVDEADQMRTAGVERAGDAELADQQEIIARRLLPINHAQPHRRLSAFSSLSLFNGERVKGEVSNAFSRARPPLRNSKSKVLVLSGCIAGEREVAEVARQIRDKQWILRPMPVHSGMYVSGMMKRSI